MNTPAEAKYGFAGTAHNRVPKVNGFGSAEVRSPHISSNTRNNDYPSAGRLLFQTAGSSTKRRARSAINLSGGIGIPYHPDDQPADIAGSVKVYARRMPILV